MWDFLTKKCGIFGIEGGTKSWDFQHRGGDFHPLTSGHTVNALNVKSNQGRTSNFEISIFIFKFLQEKSNYMERFQEFKEVISGQISLVILFFGSSSWMSVSLSRVMKR